jgi:cell division protein FtsQ
MTSMARASLDRLRRPLAAALPSAAGRHPSSRTGRGHRRRPPVGSGRAHPSLARVRGLLRVISRHRRLRVALLACLVSIPLLVGGWRWLRHSSLVAVLHVHVTGVHGPDAQAIDAALSGAARHMSTLDVNLGALRVAVAPFAVVREVRAAASFPHGLTIHVTEQPPVAALIAGATKTAVAADGVVLGPALLSSALPTVAGSLAPAPGARVGAPGLLAALTVLGAAPEPFVKVAARVYTDSNGLTVAMRNGLLAYFGDATRPHAKWRSLARVLADPGSAGASYVDVRVPEHPAAGFPSGTAPPMGAGTQAASTPESTVPSSAAGSEGTIAALAARLAGPKGSESASSPQEAASAGSSEPKSPSGAIGGSSSAPGATRAESEETSSGAGTPTTKGP